MGEEKGGDPQGLVDTPQVPNPEKYPGRAWSQPADELLTSLKSSTKRHMLFDIMSIRRYWAL